MRLINEPFQLGLGLFFSFMTFAEGQQLKAIKNKLRKVYIPILKANYMIWPLVQILNFRVVPLQFQLVSCVRAPREILETNAWGHSHLYRQLVSSGRLTSL